MAAPAKISSSGDKSSVPVADTSWFTCKVQASNNAGFKADPEITGDQGTRMCWTCGYVIRGHEGYTPRGDPRLSSEEALRMLMRR
jgi:hypothetical protein